MKRFSSWWVAAALVIAGSTAALVGQSSSGGAPEEHSGAPGDQTCSSCHFDYGFPDLGSMAINSPNTPFGFQAGVTYPIDVTVSFPGQNHWGFSLCVLDSNGASIGTLIAPVGSGTKLGLGVNGRVYATHNTVAQTTNAHTWTLNWTAPAGYNGVVKFYAACNAADGNTIVSGDYIYNDSLIITPYFVPPIPPIQAAIATQGSLQACNQLGVGFADASVGTATRNWSFPGGTPSVSTDSQVAVSFTQPGVFIARLIVSDTAGNIDTAYQSVTVFDGVDSVIASSVFNSLKASATPFGIAPPFTYSWSGQGQFTTNNDTLYATTIADTGTYTVVVTDANGCTASDTVFVGATAPPPPPPPAIQATILTIGNPIACGPVVLTFEDTTNGGVLRNWSFGNGSPSVDTSQSVQVTFTTPGVDTVWLYAEGAQGQLDTAFVIIEVFDPIAAIQFTSGLNYVATTITGGQAPYTYVWSALTPPAIISTNDTLFPTTSNSYTLTVTSADGCEFTDSVAFQVLPLPNAGITVIQGDTVGCGSISFQVQNTSTDFATYQWLINGNPVPGGNIIQTAFTIPGPKRVSIVAIDSLGRTDTATVTAVLYPSVAVEALRWGAPSSQGYQAYVNVTGGAPPYQYQWRGPLFSLPMDTVYSDSVSLFDFGAGAMNGFYEIFLTDANGCTAVDTIELLIGGLSEISRQSISVYPNPARDRVFIKDLDGAFRREAIQSVSLIGMDGRRQSLPTSGLIDGFGLEGVASGTYRLVITTKTQLYSTSLVVLPE